MGWTRNTRSADGAPANLKLTLRFSHQNNFAKFQTLKAKGSCEFPQHFIIAHAFAALHLSGAAWLRLGATRQRPKHTFSITVCTASLGWFIFDCGSCHSFDIR